MAQGEATANQSSWSVEALFCGVDFPECLNEVMRHQSDNARRWQFSLRELLMFGLSLVLCWVLAMALAVGWWLDHRSQSRTADNLRYSYDNLVHLFDDVHNLLSDEGFKLHYELEQTDGRLRLRVDSLRKPNERPEEAGNLATSRRGSSPKPCF